MLCIICILLTYALTQSFFHDYVIYSKSKKDKDENNCVKLRSWKMFDVMTLLLYILQLPCYLCVVRDLKYMYSLTI